MKKRMFLLALASAAVLGGCAASDTAKKNSSAESVVGEWRCELYGSELRVEFTEDGKFIDKTDFSENSYRIEDGRIITYVDGDEYSEVALEYSVDGDILTFGGVEYERAESADLQSGEYTDTETENGNGEEE